MAEQDSSSSVEDEVRLKTEYTEASNLIGTEIGQVASTSTEEQSETTVTGGAVELKTVSIDVNNQSVSTNSCDEHLEEAVLYVCEGEHDDVFYNHPKDKWSMMSFKVLHHPVYYVCHLIVSVLLLLLVFIEDPRIGNNQLTGEQKEAILSFHAAFELCLLLLITVHIAFRFTWFRFCHKRSLLIILIVAVMIIETITVLIRQKSHIRVTRALRVVFCMDTYLMAGVRRIVRQMFFCIKPITDILLLFFFFVAVFSLLGYYLFAEVDPDYFSDLQRTFVSLFITVTTANHPDVMMEAYQEKPASPIFFIVYVFLTLYFISNILLAVVYISFSEADKKKFKKQFLHQREALKKAFDHLAGCNERLEFPKFFLFMEKYSPIIPEWQVMCIFKALQPDPKQQHQSLSFEEFSHFYEIIDLKWDQVDENGKIVSWSQHFPPKIKKTIKYVLKIVDHEWRWLKPFDALINVTLFINVLFLIIYTFFINDPAERFQKLHRVQPVSFVFTLLYTVEIMLKVIGFGPYRYFRKTWNIIDTLMIAASLICIALEFHSAFIFIATVRPIKLLRLIRLKRCYRDAMDTIIVLLPRLSSLFFLLVVIYYIFAIIGMEFLFGRVEPGCCNTSWYGAGEYYAGLDKMNGSNNLLPSPDVYFLNNFDNILQSYVTLFILMVVNNWYIIMEGFVSQIKHGWLGRIYFMSFYIITLVVLQVAISFIVEAFVFKFQAIERSRMCNKHNSTECKKCPHEDEKRKRIKVTLVSKDILELKTTMDDKETKQSKWRCSANSCIRNFRRVDFEKLIEEVKVIEKVKDEDCTNQQPTRVDFEKVKDEDCTNQQPTRVDFEKVKDEDCTNQQPTRVDFEKVKDEDCTNQQQSYKAVHYVGQRRITRKDIHLQMYKAELNDWIEKEKEKVAVTSKAKCKWDVVKDNTEKILKYIIE